MEVDRDLYEEPHGLTSFRPWIFGTRLPVCEAPGVLSVRAGRKLMVVPLTTCFRPAVSLMELANQKSRLPKELAKSF